MNDQNEPQSQPLADDLSNAAPDQEVGTPLYGQGPAPQAPDEESNQGTAGENVYPVDADNPASVEEALRKHHESHDA